MSEIENKQRYIFTEVLTQRGLLLSFNDTNILKSFTTIFFDVPKN